MTTRFKGNALGIAAGLALSLMGACAGPAQAPTPQASRTPGRIITQRDPRDIDQCKVQPTLVWCAVAKAKGQIR
jgi:hypothetical protein